MRGKNLADVDEASHVEEEVEKELEDENECHGCGLARFVVAGKVIRLESCLAYENYHKPCKSHTHEFGPWKTFHKRYGQKVHHSTGSINSGNEK